jgi:hypothetical protein
MGQLVNLDRVQRRLILPAPVEGRSQLVGIAYIICSGYPHLIT